MKLLANIFAVLFLVSLHETLTAASVCPAGYVNIYGKCFLFETNNLMNWSASQLFCEIEGGHLAILDDCKLHQYVGQYIRNNGLETAAYGYWIGGTDAEVEKTFVWVDNTPVSLKMPFWGSEISGDTSVAEPSGGAAENCIILSSRDRYFFHDHSCSDTMPAICQAEKISNTTEEESYHEIQDGVLEYFQGQAETIICPPDYLLVGNKCLLFKRGTLEDWASAELHCQELAGSLAIIDQCNLLGEVAQYINVNLATTNKYSYWIGGTDIEREGSFEWIDTSPVYTHMPFFGQNGARPEPTKTVQQNCLILEGADRYYFHDEDCLRTSITSIICEAPPTRLQHLH